MPEIAPGVHLVEGVDPSPDFSTHVYLLKDRGGNWTLLDTGLPGSDSAIMSYLGRIGAEPRQVKKILITHLHRDHTGSLRRLIELTGARTFAHWIESAFIAQKPPYDGPGVPPAEPVTIDEVLKDGDSVDAAGGLVAYHTPGHTPGHLVFYQPEKRWLFSGDLFFGDASEVSLTPKEFTLHSPTAQISARRVAQLSIESLFTYHGGPFLKGAGAKLRTLVTRL